MRPPRIFCLMVSGPALTDELRDVLLYTAHAMAREKCARRRFACEEAEGEIETAFAHAALGSVSGMVFTAKIEMNPVGGSARFIVRTTDLEDLDKAQWVSGSFAPTRASDGRSPVGEPLRN